jgi:hypothetical protein
VLWVVRLLGGIRGVGFKWELEGSGEVVERNERKSRLATRQSQGVRCWERCGVDVDRVWPTGASELLVQSCPEQFEVEGGHQYQHQNLSTRRHGVQV